MTSSVDWCEVNYEHSRYVCELFNTLSSVALIAAGAVGFWLHRRMLEKRFRLAFVLLCLVGLGSVAFHATLRFPFQVLDEVPMLYLALVMTYALLEDRPRRRFGIWFPVALVAWAGVVTLLDALTRGRTQFYAFQLSITSLEFFALYRAFLLYRRTEAAAVRRLFRMGGAVYLSAMVLWTVDLRCCGALSRLAAKSIPNPQFHAWWHVLVASGLYALILGIAHERMRILGQSPRIAWSLGVPRLLRVGSEGARPGAASRDDAKSLHSQIT